MLKKSIPFIAFILLSATALPAAIVCRTAAAETRYSENQIHEMEGRVIALINIERQKYGLKPMPEWNVLSYYARVHSQNMADEAVSFGHDGFNDRAAAVKKYAQLINFGENVAYNYNYDDPLKVAVENWMESPGHKKNILDDFRETGVGIAFSREGRCYLTQLFATRRTKSSGK